MESLREAILSSSKTFEDTDGNKWDMKITLGTVDDVYRELGVDMLRLGEAAEKGDDKSLLEVLYQDLVLLGRVFYHIVKRQHPEITEDDFLHSLGGDAQFNADRAFRAELLGFFRAMNRMELEEMILTQSAMIETGAMVAVQEIQSLDLDLLIRHLVGEKTKSAKALIDSLE